MTLILKQSTSIDVRLGPFVDATDAVTPETGITIAAADQAEVLKANGAATVAMTGTLAAVTNADGWYDYTVQTGDVDTVGEVVFVIQDADVCLPVFVRGYVVEEAVYDAMYGASAVGPALASVCTETRLAELDAGNIPADVDAILVDTGTTLDAHLTDIKGTGFVKDTDSLTDIRTDVTGINGEAMRGTDSAALASVCTEGRLAELDAANIPTDLDAVLADTGTDGVVVATGSVNTIARAILPQTNTAYSDIEFLMVDSTDHATPKTGLSLTVTRSIDGGAFGAATGTAAEVANGIYQFDASAADMNGSIITFRFQGTDADDTFVTVRTAA